jgi:autotransporter translocation and assembly factor TamB
MGNPRKMKKAVSLISLVALMGIVLFMLRGPQISNALKKVILPELELATGRKVIAQKMYINLFPLFVEAKGMKVFDEKGERIFLIPEAKAYIELSGVLKRQVLIRRLVIKQPEVTADRRQTEEIIGNIKTYLDKVRDTAFKVKIRVLEIQKGNALFSDSENKLEAALRGLNGEMLFGNTERIKASVEKIDLKKEGWPDMEGDGVVDLSVKDDTFMIRKLVIGSLGSKLTATGDYQTGTGSFRTNIEVLLSTVRKIFSLRKSGEGKVTALGAIRYVNKKIFLDMKLNGDFYIQTLMELLKVKERVEGLIGVSGEFKGPLNDITGSGTATLRKGNLFDVDIDSLQCKISYAKGLMTFTDGEGRLFNGSAKMSAAIRLPVVNFYTLSIDFSHINSIPVFKLIGWDPGVQPGKVSGSLTSSGAKFNPEGAFQYASIAEGKDILGRISNIKGNFKMEGSILSLNDLRLATGRSEIETSGKANIGEKTLDFSFGMKTSEVSDVSSPYFDKLRGRGEVTGKITGSFDDPVIQGRIKITNPIFKNYSADTVGADVTYRKNLLDIVKMSVEGKNQAGTMSGRVYFRHARELFDLTGAEYSLTASLKNADLEKTAKIFYPNFVGSGRLQADMTIGGNDAKPNIKGTAVAENAHIYNVPFDSASFDWNYAEKKLKFLNIRIIRGRSVLAGDAGLDESGNFSYKAVSDKILLSDLIQRNVEGDAVFSIKTDGHGTFDNPSISLNARMIEGRLKGKSIGSGIISASVKDKDIFLMAHLIDDNIEVNAKGRLEKDLPWDAHIDVRTGRYDSLISALFKDVPEDLVLSLNGAVMLHGDKKHISGTSIIRKIALSMYGYSFTNEKDVRLDLNNRQLLLDKISLRSGNTSLRIDGSLELGKEYNLVFEGSSDISLFKSFSSKIGLMKGDAEFVIAVSGDWESPRINGGVNLTNGAFGLKEYPYRLGSLNGYLFMDNDKIVLQNLTGKLGGGDVKLSGIVYLQKFSVKQFYIEAALNNITASVSSDFTINFGGTVLYRGTPAAQVISGDLKVNHARYWERIEWKSWLLKAKKAEKYRAEISELEKAELNIRISATDSIRIDNNVVRASMSAEMILRGTLYHPILFGRLESKEGTVYFRNNEFKILRATGDFADPNRINPYVNITAETVVQGYKITMNLEGQLDHFNVSITSDTALKESDILSLLEVGQVGNTIGSGGLGAGEATSFITGKLQDVVEERLRSITGLDRFQIDPYVSRVTGAVEPRVTVSKRLLSDKMSVTYSSSANSTEEQIIKLEYFLNKNMSLVGVRDERGIIGGDIQFRFQFK